MELGKAVFEYRMKNLISQAEMAKLVGVDRATIIRVEGGKGVSKLTEAKIKMVLEKEADANA